MTQEEKDLLLKDLSARLSYGVIVNASYKDGDGWKNEDRELLGIYKDKQIYLNGIYTTIEDIKPYLRPMSSMTKEEYDQLYIDSRVKEDSIDILDALANDMDAIDWLNQHHFDYRDLIEKGLALVAPEGMYNG